MDQFLNTETLVIELLLIASLVAMAVHRLRIPYTVALVVVGLLITFQQRQELNLTPEVILGLFVPPLVFEAAFHINFTDLQRNLSPVLLLAIPGVILTTLIVGLVVASGTGLALPVALLFGALMTATDPVAVVAVFRTLRVPKRLAILVEGESLLNDGTGIVLFNLALAAALTGGLNLTQGVADFVRVSAGGIVTGLALGWVISRLIARVDDYLIETTLTTVLAFGSYLLAERLSFSGVLAVVAAGLVNGNLGPQGMSPTTRIVLFSFWEYVAFLANSLIFLLIGLQVNISALMAAWQPVVWAIAAVLSSRVIVVYGLSWVANRWVEPIPASWQHILTWSGLRGAISLALALSLPTAVGPDRELLRVMAFGVVLFTLLAQGTTMGPLVRWLRIVTQRESEIEYELRHARVTALRAAERHLELEVHQGIVSAHAWQALKPELDENASSLADAVREVMIANPELEAEEMRFARQELLRAQRGALLGLARDGVISDEALEKLSAEVDAELERLRETPEEDGATSDSGGTTPS